MEIETEDRKYALRFFRVQAKVSQLLLEQEPGLSKEARECLQKHHDYCAECHRLLLKKKLTVPDRPDIPAFTESVCEEIQNAIKRRMGVLGNA